MLGQSAWIDNDSQLAFAATKGISAADTGYPLQPVANCIFDKIAVFVNWPVVARYAFQNKPGNRIVFTTGCGQTRLVGFVRVATDPVQPVGDQQQGPVHVHLNPELQGDLSLSVLRRADHLLQSFQAFQSVFLAIDDFPFNFRRSSSKPAGFDGNDGAAHIGCQLHRNGPQRQYAEHDDHQDSGDNGDGPVNRGADQIHNGTVCLVR